MKVLVTGANGMLGQDLCPILEDIGCFVIPTDYDTLDITDPEATNKAMKEIHPDLVVHCAAYTNVDKAEKDYDGAYKLNVTGTANVAKAASEVGATMVYISTDYVFDGSKEGVPCLPTDKPSPISVYGETKFLGEAEVQKYCNKFYIARTSWLYGICGKNFVETMLGLGEKGTPLKVVDDQTGSPTWTVDLVNGIIKLLNKPYGVYHLSGRGETTWYNFAKKIFELENLKVDLSPCTTEEFPRDAKRPKYSYMENIPEIEAQNLMRPWESGLVDYLRLRKETNAR